MSMHLADRYELVKLFDCQKMPEDVKKNFFEMAMAGQNDSIEEWTLDTEPTDITDLWLIANGAEAGEVVYIYHWW